MNPDDAQICCYCGNSVFGYTSQQHASNNNGYYEQQGFQQPYQPSNVPHGYHNFNENDYYARNNAFDSDRLGKSRGIAALLAIFFGSLGVQYFYLNKITGGLITILLSIVTCGLWSLLTFVQGIVLLCSDNYYFDRKFVYSNSALPLF